MDRADDRATQSLHYYMNISRTYRTGFACKCLARDNIVSIVLPLGGRVVG